MVLESSALQDSCAFWFRRDLRLDDNHGLYQALASGRPVVPIFIFDSEILKHLPADDARVMFIYDQLVEMNLRLRDLGRSLQIYHGDPRKLWPKIAREWKIGQVFFNEDYEPSAIARDEEVVRLLSKQGCAVQSFKDQVIFAKNEVVKDGGDPYRVYTPYSKRWLAQFQPNDLAAFASAKKLEALAKTKSSKFPSLKELGFEESGRKFPPSTISKSILKNYAGTRDQLGLNLTSHLGLHLRFGTISIRKLVGIAKELSSVYLGELIWREFFMQILFQNPQTVNEPFDSRFKNVQWRTAAGEFEKWCEGQTGYPVVDAGMRELNETGFMHNRARMITASFLTKHLLIDWRKGERYFAEKLLDYEQASNVGNWQWVAGCGCDAAPYFRIFNPTLQAKRFDANGTYVKRWVPEIGTKSYPDPMVDHEIARKRALVTFKRALSLQPKQKHR